MTASFMSAGAPSSVRTFTWTASTWPTSTASVPGRAFRPSMVLGSGPCSSWYSASVHPEAGSSSTDLAPNAAKAIEAISPSASW